MPDTNPYGLWDPTKAPLPYTAEIAVFEDLFTDDYLAAEASWNDFQKGGTGVWYTGIVRRKAVPAELTEDDARAREDAERDMEGES